MLTTIPETGLHQEPVDTEGEDTEMRKKSIQRPLTETEFDSETKLEKSVTRTTLITVVGTEGTHYPASMMMKIMPGVEDLFHGLDE